MTAAYIRYIPSTPVQTSKGIKTWLLQIGGSLACVMAVSRILLLSLPLLSLTLCAPQPRDEIEIQDCGEDQLMDCLTHIVTTIITITGSQAELLSLTFDGCSEFPCIVHQGQHATGQLTMRARTPTSSLTCKVWGGGWLCNTLCILRLWGLLDRWSYHLMDVLWMHVTI